MAGSLIIDYDTRFPHRQRTFGSLPESFPGASCSYWAGTGVVTIATAAGTAQEFGSSLPERDRARKVRLTVEECFWVKPAKLRSKAVSREPGG